MLALPCADFSHKHGVVPKRGSRKCSRSLVLTSATNTASSPSVAIPSSFSAVKKPFGEGKHPTPSDSALDPDDTAFSTSRDRVETKLIHVCSSEPLGGAVDGRGSRFSHDAGTRPPMIVASSAAYTGCGGATPWQ